MSDQIRILKSNGTKCVVTMYINGEKVDMMTDTTKKAKSSRLWHNKIT